MTNIYSSPLKRTVVCALLAAISTILGTFLKIPINLAGVYAMKLSIGMIPIILAAIMFGPLYGGLVGAIADIATMMIMPLGGFNPLFTLTTFCLGVIPGLFFLKNSKVTFLKVLLAVAVSQILGSVLFNTMLISLTYGTPFITLLVPRFINQLVHIPIFAAGTFAIYQSLIKTKILPPRVAKETEVIEASETPPAA